MQDYSDTKSETIAIHQQTQARSMSIHGHEDVPMQPPRAPRLAAMESPETRSIRELPQFLSTSLSTISMHV